MFSHVHHGALVYVFWFAGSQILRCPPSFGKKKSRSLSGIMKPGSAMAYLLLCWLHSRVYGWASSPEATRSIVNQDFHFGFLGSLKYTSEPAALNLYYSFSISFSPLSARNASRVQIGQKQRNCAPHRPSTTALTLHIVVSTLKACLSKWGPGQGGSQCAKARSAILGGGRRTRRWPRDHERKRFG